ncbi:DsbA family oxidoreductase [uncultured Williamsia sp.]|uniref:DsbA family oxidoreductase n=1 Tax=uncultured Williamsia sp. TaxID=259311 RepID=UPI002621E7B5|nr:DsbA family oxidoreductase [uncultured Williamsia sp.]
MTADPLTVDIWSDIACPWCYLGTRRFETALAEFDGRDDVVVTHHSFELAPDTPVDFDGSEVDFLVQHKGLPAAQARQMLAQMTETGAQDGVRYDFDALRHTNTRKAHEVLHLAKADGLQRELVDRMFAAYFAEGRHLGGDEDLADLAAEVGLDRDEVLIALEEGTYADAVTADIEQAREYGITGVPFFVLDGRYGISGAQSPEVLRSALEQVRAER